MELEEFEQALKKDDFGVGDSFWLGEWEFEVVSRKKQGVLLCGDEPAFKWELTREDFLQVIRDSHPEIQNPEEFFDRYEDEIIHYFKKGFDVLIGECGATYATVINDAIDEVIK